MSKKHEGLLSIDPGLADTGWAIFLDGILISCGVARFKLSCKLEKEFSQDAKRLLAISQITKKIQSSWQESMGLIKTPDKLVIEQPGFVKYDFLKILPLGILGGVLWEKMQPNQIVFVTPKTWNNGAPKEVTAKKTALALSTREQNIAIDCLRNLPKDSVLDGYDAIGIGRWYLSRLKQQ